ncbi:MAG: isochorismatase family cysteine hydrolase [Halodesulfurarchaeum sp.]|nr:isochorismatase family cysteine hydrolase [Halodesulfurarchaeum sp.]
MQFDPAATAIVVVDMQNDFCHPDGALYAEASEAVIEPIAQLVSRSREAGAQVVFTRDVHPPDQFEDAHYTDEFERWGEHVLEGSWGAEIVADLSVEEDDHVVEKHTYDAFYGTDFETFLEKNGIEDLLFVGTLANVCVLHTAGSAALRDYKPVLVSDAVGYVDPDHRDYALEHAEWVFGETVTREAIEFQ